MVNIIILIGVSPFLILAIHAAASRYFLRYRPKISRQIICVLSILIGYIPTYLLLWHFVIADMASIQHKILPTIFYGLIIYNALGYCYFHIFNMSETSRRVRILYELYRAGSLSASDVASLYDVQDILSVRIDRLISMGQIKKNDGRYVLDGLILYYAAKLVAFWAYLIGIPMGSSSPSLETDQKYITEDRDGKSRGK